MGQNQCIVQWNGSEHFSIRENDLQYDLFGSAIFIFFLVYEGNHANARI